MEPDIRPDDDWMWSWAYEIFREPPGFPGYLIGSNGTFWSRWQKGRWNRLLPIWQKRCPSPDPLGYLHVNLYLPGQGRRQHFKMHYLVLAVFRGPKPPGLEIRHLNGDPGDNRLSNIAYGTSLENNNDIARHGHRYWGSRHHNAKLTEEIVQIIKDRLRHGEGLTPIAREYGVSVATIFDIAHGKTWKQVEIRS